MFVDNKGAIKGRKSKKHRKCNHQKKRNNDQQNTTQKTKDRTTPIHLNNWDERMRSGRVSSFYSTSGNRRVNLVTHQVISHE